MTETEFDPVAVLIIGYEHDLADATARYRHAIQYLARQFALPDGPDFESSVVETEWREHRSKMRHLKSTIAALRRAQAAKRLPK